MDRNDISVLAEGMVPFVRETVAEAFANLTVPPPLAQEVARAVRLLHETPPVSSETAKTDK